MVALQIRHSMHYINAMHTSSSSLFFFPLIHVSRQKTKTAQCYEEEKNSEWIGILVFYMHKIQILGSSSLSYIYMYVIMFNNKCSTLNERRSYSVETLHTCIIFTYYSSNTSTTLLLTGHTEDCKRLREKPI